jgi:hypothetical protein
MENPDEEMLEPLCGSFLRSVPLFFQANALLRQLVIETKEELVCQFVNSINKFLLRNAEKLFLVIKNKARNQLLVFSGALASVC